MFNQTKGSDHTQHSHNLEVVMINDSRFAVEERNGNICFNLTQMAKPFGKEKRPGSWLRTEESESYIEALTVVQKCATADLVEVRQGGTPERQGTWANDYRIAMRFAQWLDPKFSIAVDELVFKLLTKQMVVVEPRRGVMPIIIDGKQLYPYRESVVALGGGKKSSASKRKKLHPHHFVKVFGRNFITPHYFSLMEGYYNWRIGQKSNQLSLELNEKGGTSC